MKRAYLLMILMLGLLVGCTGEIKTVEFSSPEGDNRITINGERQGAVGPIVTRVNMKSSQHQTTFTFEHQASSLTEENVSATWENNNHAVLKFVLDDGDYWETDCFFLGDTLQAVKRFKLGGTIFD